MKFDRQISNSTPVTPAICEATGSVLHAFVSMQALSCTVPPSERWGTWSGAIRLTQRVNPVELHLYCSVDSRRALDATPVVGSGTEEVPLLHDAPVPVVGGICASVPHGAPKRHTTSVAWSVENKQHT